VCSYDWDFNDAEVACRQMGYPGVLNSLTSRLDAYGEFRGPIWWASVGCTGGELRLEDCPKDNSSVHTCDHKDDVVVECLPRTDATIHRNATIRLKDGNSSYSGRVEVLFDGKWGTVCDYGWDQRDAQVVCRQLGYQAGAQAAVNRAQFGEGKDQPIWMGNVRCSGKEKSIRDCAFDSKAHESCSHRQDVGVICRTISSIFPIC
jgi:serine protease 12 (motopsin)